MLEVPIIKPDGMSRGPLIVKLHRRGMRNGKLVSQPWEQRGTTKEGPGTERVAREGGFKRSDIRI